MIRATAEADRAWAEHLGSDIESIYGALTDDFRARPRIAELVYAAAERFPDHLPSRAAIDAEQELLQKDKAGLEINQGLFVAHVLAHERTGFHLMHSMSQPTAAALALLDDFRRDGQADLGPIRVDRDGEIGHVTIQNHAHLNSEDDVSVAALEVAVDLVLLDDAIGVGVLRGAPATHHKYAGRRIFGSGINLTHLYQGKISLLEFMLERELGGVSKMYRGHDLGATARRCSRAGARSRSSPRSTPSRSAARASSCSSWTTSSRSRAPTSCSPPARRGSSPAAPTCACRASSASALARQALFFNRSFPADSPGGPQLADAVLPADEMDEAIRSAAAEVVSAGRRASSQPPGAPRGAGAARPLPPLHEQLCAGAGPLPLQPRADRQPRAQLECARAGAVTGVIGVIGGSGLYELFAAERTVEPETPYGPASAPIALATIAGVPTAFLPRHGLEHQFPPHRVPYRANLWALRSVGVTRIVAPCAAGSLRPDLPPGTFVVCDQFVDRTTSRAHTFFDGPDVRHVSAADPYCADLRATLLAAGGELGLPMRDGGTVVVIEGPRFSTRAESAWFRSMGWDLVNMTAYPEGWLARELGLCYANLSLDDRLRRRRGGRRGACRRDRPGRAGGVCGEHRAAPRPAGRDGRPRRRSPARRRLQSRRSTMPRCSRNHPAQWGQAPFERLLPTAASWLLPYWVHASEF